MNSINIAAIVDNISLNLKWARIVGKPRCGTHEGQVTCKEDDSAGGK